VSVLWPTGFFFQFMGSKLAAVSSDRTLTLTRTSERINLIEPTGSKERIKDRRATSPLMRASEVVILATDSNVLHLSLYGVVVELIHPTLHDPKFGS